MVEQALILFVVSLFVFFSTFAFFFGRESAEESATVALGSVLATGLAFPHLCRLGILCLYEQPPVALYSGAYAVVGAASVGLIAQFESRRRLESKIKQRSANAATTLVSLVTVISVGLVTWKYDSIIGIPIRPFVILIPAYWMFGRMIYEDWPG